MGNPWPTILWYKDGHRLTDAVADFPTLVFPRLDLSDRGFYYCEAFSFQGGLGVSNVSKAVTLNIEGNCISLNQILIMRKCMSAQCYPDIVQYEADITLPEDFYEDSEEMQPTATKAQQLIENLLLTVC